MAKATTKLLPAQRYTFIDVTYNGEGQRCQNCNRVVHYVGEVWGRSDNVHYFIGMDCAKTVTEAGDFRYHDRRFGDVRKALKALNEYAALQQVDAAVLREEGEHIECKWEHGFKCVVLKVPRWGSWDYHNLVDKKDWNTLFLPVRDKLTALGIALPEVPAE